MTIAEKTFKAIRDSQKILAEYIVPDSGISDHDVISSLLGVLDNRELVAAMNEDDEGAVVEIPQMAGTMEALENLSITKSPDRNTGQKILQDFMDAPNDFEHIGVEAEKDGVDLITVKHKETGDVYYYSQHLQYKSLAEQVKEIGEYRCGWKYLRRP